MFELIVCGGGLVRVVRGMHEGRLITCFQGILLRCDSLVLYRIMDGNRVVKVQRRNNFVVGSDYTYTEIIS